jgi:ABC-type dipeptide/oligopeptide/nickel transport system permease component
VRGYVLRRLLAVAPVLLGVSILAFGLGRLAPGDPARELLTRTTARQPSQAEVRELRAQLGLDDPLPEQYGRWLRDALHGDLGSSYATGEPVVRSIAATLPLTLELAGAAFLLSLVVGIPLGVLAAARSWTWIDHVVRSFALLGASIPAFWLSYVLILVFAVRLQLLPPFGAGGLDHLVMPATALAVFDIAVLARFTRSGVLETLGTDFVRTARGKGLSERRVLTRHALRVALIPLVTWSSLNLAYLIGYSVVVETVFAWPGLGYTAVNAITARDYPFIQAFVLLMGVVFIFLNLIVDLAYTWIDPRLRFGNVESLGAP